MKEKLKIMLKDIIPIFDGIWFVSCGGLLGIVREGDLLEWDDDIDIYILPDTKINWDKLPKKLNYYKDYICYKIYDRDEPKTKMPNNWLRYLSYKRSCYEYFGFNRAQLTKSVAPFYQYESKADICRSHWIDIFTLVYDPLNDRWKIPYLWGKKEFYFTKRECETEIDTTLGFPINIPQNCLDVLQRTYGDGFMIEDREHKH